MLWPTVSQSVCLGVGHPFGAHDQILLFPFFCRKIALLLVLGRPLWRVDGSIICMHFASSQSRGGLIILHYCLTWDYWVPFPSPLMTRRHYGGSILTRLHKGTFWREDGSVICSAMPVVRVAEDSTIHYCLTWDYWVHFPSPLTTRRDYGGSILFSQR
jgi:hypothetical protein